MTDRQVVVTVPAAATTGPVTASVDGATPTGGTDFRVAPCALFSLQLPQSSVGGGTGALVVGHSSAFTTNSTTFTAEAWLHPIGTFSGDALFKDTQFRLGIVGDRLVGAVYTQVGWVVAQGANPVPDGWFHAAVTYEAGVVRTYVNGAVVATTTSTNTNMNTSGSTFFIGGQSSPFRGEIDMVRLSRNARYGAAGFTRPTTRHVNDAQTIGLWFFDETPQSATGGLDSGNDNLTLSRSGAAYRWPSTAPIECQ